MTKKGKVRIGKYKVYHRFECEEPMACLSEGCKNDFNGLHHFWIKIKKFTFDTWLCQECAKQFKKDMTQDDPI